MEKIVLESEYEFQNVDEKELAKYLKIVVSKEELERSRLSGHMPRRRVQVEGRTRGVVTIAYLDTDHYTSTDKGKKSTKEKWMWEEWTPPGQQEMKVLVALLLREEVKVKMTNHLYTFGVELP